jgi:6-phosphogluconolactonase (cycloisomerase 2 family)
MRKTIGLVAIGAWMVAGACVGDTEGTNDAGPDVTVNDTGAPETATETGPPDAGPPMYGRFAYAANGADGTITAFAVDGPTGFLRLGGYALGGKAGRLAIDATGKHLYATSGAASSITMFAIGPDGSLPFNGVSKTLGGQPTSLALEPTGHYAYVVANGNIYQFSIDGTGALTALSTPSVPTGTSSLAHAIAVDGAGKFLYVAADDGLVYEYSIGGNGLLSPGASSTIPGGAGGQAITIDPSSKHAYVTSVTDNAVYQYAISANGALAALSPVKASTGGQPMSVVVDPTGKYAYVANHGDSTVSQFDVGANGALTAMTPATAATGANPLAVTLDASGKFAYTENPTDDTVAQLTVGSNGALTLTRTIRTRDNPTAFAITSGPTPLSYKLEFAYASSYYASDAGANVGQYTIGTTGQLSGVGVAPAAGGAGRFIATNPAGSYLYVSNLLGQSISQYGVGSTGTLTPLTPTFVLTAGTGPIGISIDPNGRFLYDVNYYANNVGAFSITAGKLTALGSAVASGSSPVCSALDPTGRFLYASNSDSQATGSTGPNTSISSYSLDDTNTGLLTTRATTTLANDDIWCVGVEPTGKYAYAVTNAATTGTIYQYKLDTSGVLVPLVPATLSTGSGAGIMAFDPYGRFAYVINAPTSGNGSVSQYAINAGALTPLSPPQVSTGQSPSSITIDIAGLHAYVTNATDDSISQYDIGADGTLKQMTPATVADYAGTYPTSITTTGAIQ